jgi:hypothetical protein
VDGRNMTNEEKIEFLNIKINNFNMHINVLERDILENPNSDHPDKTTRQSVLNDFYSKKQAIIQEIEKLVI